MTNYFETMGIPIVKGRGFEPTDIGSGPVVIVNETLVNTFWKDVDPVGQTLKPGLTRFVDLPDFRVIGVVGRSRWSPHSPVSFPTGAHGAPIRTSHLETTSL